MLTFINIKKIELKNWVCRIVYEKKGKKVVLAYPRDAFYVSTKSNKEKNITSVHRLNGVFT